MGYMNKRPSRIQGQFYFLKLGRAGNTFWLGSNFFIFVLWGLPGGARLWAHEILQGGLVSTYYNGTRTKLGLEISVVHTEHHY